MVSEFTPFLLNRLTQYRRYPVGQWCTGYKYCYVLYILYSTDWACVCVCCRLNEMLGQFVPS